MLNPDLDLDALRDEFARERRIRMKGVLDPAIAAAIADEMLTLRYMLFCATATTVAIADPAEADRWDPAQRAELNRSLMEAASRSEGYFYHNHRMTEAWKDGPPDTPLGRFHTWLASPTLHDAIGHITGGRDFDNVQAQATRYLPGHYLTRHLDEPKGERRRLAFVWGLTRRWMPDWGGLLQFYTHEGDPTVSFAPGFNTLDLFAVSHVHAVTFVAPFARAPRLAVSGWFVKGDPLAKYEE